MMNNKTYLFKEFKEKKNQRKFRYIYCISVGLRKMDGNKKVVLNIPNYKLKILIKTVKRYRCCLRTPVLRCNQSLPYRHNGWITMKIHFIK